jgi:hypothetical protein
MESVRCTTSFWSAFIRGSSQTYASNELCGLRHAFETTVRSSHRYPSTTLSASRQNRRPTGTGSSRFGARGGRARGHGQRH